MVTDIRDALRALEKSPGFAFVGIVSLALAIAANTIVFGVLNGLILRPLPVANPREVFTITRNSDENHSFPSYRELRDRNTTLTGVAACRIAPMGLQSTAGSRRIWGYLATGNYFDVLGIKPAIGRFFTPAEDTTPGGAPYAVLSFSAWQSWFAGDANIAGRTIRINGDMYSIVGVAPKGLRHRALLFARCMAADDDAATD
jgi:hypothetical protein